MSRFEAMCFIGLNFIINAYNVALFYSSLMPWKKNGLFNSKFRFTIAFFMYAVILSPIRELYNIHAIIMFLMLLFTIYFNFDQTLKFKIFVSAVLFLLCFLCEFSLFVVCRFLYGLTSFTSYLTHDLMLAAIAPLANSIVYIALMTFVCLWKTTALKQRIRFHFIYLILPIYQFVLLYMYLLNSELNKKTAIIGNIIFIFNFIIVNIIHDAIDGMSKKIEMEEAYSALYIQRELEHDYYKLIQNHAKQGRILRHDFINQLQTAYALLDTQKQPPTSELITSYCSNNILNAILNMKYQTAIAKGIQVTISTDIPENMAIDPLDLCSLYCNLIDNAIEACEQIQTSDKKIFIYSRYYHSTLHIEIQNTKKHPLKLENGKLLTSKDDKSSHGIGLHAVSDIVHKYLGQINFIYDEISFTTMITFKTM